MAKDTKNSTTCNAKRKSVDRQKSTAVASANSSSNSTAIQNGKTNGRAANGDSKKLIEETVNGSLSHESTISLSTNSGDNEDDSRSSNTIDITVGKKGGTFSLPFGGQLSVPPDAVAKRGVITCTQVSTQERCMYEPTLRNGEKLASELFVVDTHGSKLKRPVGIQLKHLRISREFEEVGVLWRPSNSTFWQSAESNPSTEAVIDFVAAAGGAFVVISYPRSERFELPAQGCLYSTRLHRLVTVRCPKGAAGTDVQCDLQIIPMRPESLQSPAAQADIVASTDFIRFTTNMDVFEFKRPLTIKLPLPVQTTAEIKAEDLAVCQTMASQDGRTNWIVLDGPFKLTKSSVSFDTKSLTKFLVVIVKPPNAAGRAMLPRGVRLQDTLARIELDNSRPRVDILPFVHLAAKHWTLCVDCVRKDKVQDAIDARADMLLIKPSSLQPVVAVSRSSDAGFRRVSRTSTTTKNNQTAMNGGTDGNEAELRASNGSVFIVEVAGDVEISDENGDSRDNNKITYHHELSQNCRQFTLIPKATSVANGPKVLTCIVRVYQQQQEHDDPNDRSNYAVRCFDFDIPLSTVADYLYVEPEPEPELPPSPAPVDRNKLATYMASLHTQSVTAASQPAVVRRDPKEIAETFNRLTKSTRVPTVVPKEPRVLSGRSLQCLAREVPAGINLALHLDISESTITGMAFDALANGQQSADITYRILLLWKRRSAAASVGINYRTSAEASGTAQVEALAAAIEAVGYSHVAVILLDRHRVNKELTPDCFILTDTNADEPVNVGVSLQVENDE